MREAPEKHEEKPCARDNQAPVKRKETKETRGRKYTASQRSWGWGWGEVSHDTFSTKPLRI